MCRWGRPKGFLQGPGLIHADTISETPSPAGAAAQCSTGSIGNGEGGVRSGRQQTHAATGEGDNNGSVGNSLGGSSSGIERGGDKPSIASTRFLDKPQKNKEPAPHTEPQTQWVMCKGKCKVEFGWSVESQAHYRTHNRPPPRFCLFCADERNKRKRARANDT